MQTRSRISAPGRSERHKAVPYSCSTISHTAVEYPSPRSQLSCRPDAVFRQEGSVLSARPCITRPRSRRHPRYRAAPDGRHEVGRYGRKGSSAVGGHQSWISTRMPIPAKSKSEAASLAVRRTHPMVVGFCVTRSLPSASRTGEWNPFLRTGSNPTQSER